MSALTEKSTSVAQQQAAGIAHAVEKGELPKSKLRGASAQMYKGMKGKGELHKFAATKHKGLPQHVPEFVEALEDLAEQIVDSILDL